MTGAATLRTIVLSLALSFPIAATATEPSPAESAPAAEATVAKPAKRNPVDVALQYLGVRYRFGGNSFKGVDCSGLVRLVFRELGVVLPPQSSNQYRLGEEVTREKLMPGDLIFFKDTYRRGISHVAIYIGGSRFIHASRKGVAVASLSSEYYANRFAGARRVHRDEPVTADVVKTALTE
jgi:cell wall-associated NlpC family hydrolase